jgi:hypothetical protein
VTDIPRPTYCTAILNPKCLCTIFEIPSTFIFPYFSNCSKYCCGSSLPRALQFPDCCSSCQTASTILPDKITYLKQNIQRIPTWGLYLAYRADVTYLRLEHELGSPGSIEELQNLRQTLRTMDTRWRVAGVPWLL